MPHIRIAVAPLYTHHYVYYMTYRYLYTHGGRVDPKEFPDAVIKWTIRGFNPYREEIQNIAGFFENAKDLHQYTLAEFVIRLLHGKVTKTMPLENWHEKQAAIASGTTAKSSGASSSTDIVVLKRPAAAQ